MPDYDFDSWDEKVRRFMTKDMAQLVRRLRVDEQCSWRLVSERFEQHHPGLQPGFAGHQLSGMSLCTVAARMLDQDPCEAPWN